MSDPKTTSLPGCAIEGPERAHSLILNIGADTREDLVAELLHLASELDRDRLTVGCGGGPSNGGMWSYRVRPEQTHDAYFQQVDAWLAAKAAERDKEPANV